MWGCGMPVVRFDLKVWLISLIVAMGFCAIPLAQAGESGSYGQTPITKPITKPSIHKQVKKKKAKARPSINLAGEAGKVRYHASVGPDDPCGQMYSKYKKASGHSAYATNYSFRAPNGFFCGYHLNAGSAAQAEKYALASCESAKKKYKVKVPAKCTISASK